MKTASLVLAIALAAALGVFALQQKNRAAHMQQQLAALQAQIDELQASLDEKTAALEETESARLRAKVLQDTLSQASEVSKDQSNQVAQLEQSLAAAKTNRGGIGRIFQDPEMRKMIRAQQDAFMGPMIERTYGGLFQELGLTKEQADHVKSLLQRKMSVNTDLGLSLLDESADAAKRKEIGDQIRSETTAIDQSLREFLGEENFARLQQHEKSIPDRAAVSQIKEQLAGSGAALDAQQEQQLNHAMAQLRQNFKWTTDYSNQNPADLNPAEMFTEERLARQAEEQRQYNQRLLDDAKAFLRPDQLTALETHLESQRKMQEAAMKMAARMLGPNQSQTPQPR